MTAGRVDEICDLARAVIEAAAAVPANEIAGTAVEVACEDDPDVRTDEMPPGQMKVFVTWVEYEDGGPASRGEDITDFQLVFIVVEVCGEAGKVPNAWRRLRTKWVDACIVRALGDARESLGGAYAMRLDAVTFDLEEMAERKAFWSGVAITFRDIE